MLRFLQITVTRPNLCVCSSWLSKHLPTYVTFYAVMFDFSGLREPPVLVPVLLWVFWHVNDWLLDLDSFQSPFHIGATHHLWCLGQRRVCGDTHAAPTAVHDEPEICGRLKNAWPEANWNGQHLSHFCLSFLHGSLQANMKFKTTYFIGKIPRPVHK